MGAENLVNGDETLRKWLGEFSKESTRTTYACALNMFKKNLNITDLGKYLSSSPDVVADIRSFLSSLNGKPSKTINTYVGAVKMFLQDQGMGISEDEWRKIRRRGFMPKRVKAETRDRKPLRADLRKILNYADIKCRAMVLFLLSSGARIGETLQLKHEDLSLDADPPEASIRSEYTKGGVGGRTVYFSYEARDAVKCWLKIKDKVHRRSGDGTYTSERIFPWSTGTAVFMWNNACEKAGLNLRDNHTQRRIYHLHSLRKFFRSCISLDQDITHALMGHTEYLDDSYLRLEQEGEIARAYKDAMANVSIYAVEDQELRKQTETLEQENLELKSRLAKVELEVTKLAKLIEELIK